MSMETQEFDIAQVIPVGRENAVSREWLAKKLNTPDRMVRRLIAESNLPIINIGNGYFIPNEDDTIDMSYLHCYVAQERARISTLQEKLNMKFGRFMQE